MATTRTSQRSIPLFRTLLLTCGLVLVATGGAVAFAQAQPNGEGTAPPAAQPPQPDHAPSVEEVAEAAEKKVTEFAHEVDQDVRAKRVSAGILQPIYDLAEKLAFPAFHWIAFALMATGVVNYALQLVLGKLLLLMRLSFSLQEVLADALGLVISLFGLVLTTQAAAQNSTFTTSPFAVLSASLVGVVAGFVFFRWGQQLELQAAKGRSVSQPAS